MISKMKKIALLIMVAALTLVGCDVVEGPYMTLSDREDVTVDFPELNPDEVYRKVLMEEYTGHRCSNCPTAHQILDQLHTLYGDTLVIVGIHATSLANPNLDYPYDFRTEVGTQLANDFGINAIPAAIFNREIHTGGWGKDEWMGHLREMDRSTVPAAIQLINQYDASSAQLKVNAQVTMLEEYNHPLYLSIFLIEDGIVQPQLSGLTQITDYTHNHVLRAAINGTYGSYLTTDGLLEKDNAYTYACSTSFLEHDWKAANCTVVAFLYDRVNGEVLQVETLSVLQ